MIAMPVNVLVIDAQWKIVSPVTGMSAAWPAVALAETASPSVACTAIRPSRTISRPLPTMPLFCIAVR